MRFKVGRKTVRVADERDALAVVRQAPRLLHRHKGLSAPRTSTRVRSLVASRMTAWRSVRTSAASSFSSARATTSRCGRPRPLSAIWSCPIPVPVRSGRSISGWSRTS